MNNSKQIERLTQIGISKTRGNFKSLEVSKMQKNEFLEKIESMGNMTDFQKLNLILNFENHRGAYGLNS